jgi:hypothetical protein
VQVVIVLAHPLAFDIEDVWQNLVLGIEELIISGGAHHIG